MHAEKTGAACQEFLKHTRALKKKLARHNRKVKCAKAIMKQQHKANQRCIPRGSTAGTTGGVAVVEFRVSTSGTCGVSNEYTEKWNRYWKNFNKLRLGAKPASCAFVVALTLTKKVDSSVKHGPGKPLVQSFAAIADAKGAGCKGFIWIADMIARDALSATRFKLAEQLL